MKASGIAVALLVIAAAAITIDPPSTGTGTEPTLDADGLPPGIEYPGELGYRCDEQWNPVEVVPDDLDAHRAAERGCTRMRLSLEQLELPGGMTVQPGGIFDQEGSHP